jgi:hypothetical protein
MAAMLLVASFLAACKKEEPPPPPKVSGAFVPAPANTAPVEPPPKLAYVDVTKAAGIDFVHETGAFGQKYLPETMGAGCAFLDYDGDGDSDLLLLDGAQWPGHEIVGKVPSMRLYRNDGGWKFTDVTLAAGLRGSEPPPGNPPPEVRVALLWDEAAQKSVRQIRAKKDPDDAALQSLIQETRDAFAKMGDDVPVVIDADPRVPWKDVVALMDLVKRAGVERIEFAFGAPGETPAFYGMGCAVADADGDGDSDLFVTGVGGYRYFRNDGGRFADATKESGLDNWIMWVDDNGKAHDPFATSAAFLDYDGDGRPDLFVCHYVQWSPDTDIPSMLGKNRSYAIPTQYRGQSCRLWRNLGEGRFEDATDAAGVHNEKGKSLGVAVIDLGDGRPSLVVANDTQPNYLYRNLGGGKFAEIGVKCGVGYDRNGRARAGMGIDVAPLAAGGHAAFAIGNFSGEPVSLWEEIRTDCFVDKADVAGIALVTQPSLTFGVRFLDADLDGRADLLLANGHIEPTIQETQKDIAYAQPTQLLRGQDGGRFADVTALVGPDLQRPRVARSVAVADVDGDGDLDVCLTVNGGAPALLRCDLENSAARSLRVRVRGNAPATDALGAKVTVTCGARTVTQWVRSGGGYLGQSELTLTFGLGDAGKADKVEIRWPDGATKTLENVAHGVLEAQP